MLDVGAEMPETLEKTFTTTVGFADEEDVPALVFLAGVAMAMSDAVAKGNPAAVETLIGNAIDGLARARPGARAMVAQLAHMLGEDAAQGLYTALVDVENSKVLLRTAVRTRLTGRFDA